MSTVSPLRANGVCSLEVDTTLPLVCIGSLLSFLCGVGIGANDLSANFAMVVGSGSLNMKQAIVYCTIFELLGAAFMGGHVGNTIRNGIVQSSLFNQNRDLVIIGMTCATFASAMWLYLSTVFGLPVSITHTVIGSIIGYAVFSTWSFSAIQVRGVVVIVLSWVLAPVAACAVTAACFYWMRRYVLQVPHHSFDLALRVLPYCLALSLLVDYMFVVIERPPILTVTLAAYLPVWALYLLLLLGILAFCWISAKWAFPTVAHIARSSSSFVWESPALRTEPVDVPAAIADVDAPAPAEGLTRAAVTAASNNAAAGVDSATFSPMSVNKPSSRPPSEAGSGLPAPSPQPAAAVSAGSVINTSFGSLLFSKTVREEPTGAASGSGSGVTTDALAAAAAASTSATTTATLINNADDAPRGLSPAPRPSATSRGRTSTVLTSITASDGHLMRSTSVHLAPVGGRRSPLASRGPAGAPTIPTASTSRSVSRSATPAMAPEKEASGSAPASESYRHFDPSQMPTSQTASPLAATADSQTAPLLARNEAATSAGLLPPPTLPHYGATESVASYGESGTTAGPVLYSATFVAPSRPRTRHAKETVAAATAAAAAVVESDSDGDTESVRSDDEFGEEDWMMDHPMQPIRFGGLLIKPFNPRAEYLFTGLQVVAGSMSSFVHGAVAGANATATFVILYDVFTNHELGESGLSARWSVMPAMLGIAIGMFTLGAALMKTVGMELVTVTPARGWCIQVGGTLVTMVLTGLGIPVSLSQSQVGAAIGCGMLDAKMKGVSWKLVGKIVGGWVVTLLISAVTTGLCMMLMGSLLCQ